MRLIAEERIGEHVLLFDVVPCNTENGEQKGGGNAGAVLAGRAVKDQWSCTRVGDEIDQSRECRRVVSDESALEVR